MAEGFEANSSLMARLTISAIDRASSDPCCWSDPIVHRALLVSGLSVLIASTRLLNADLEAH